ncbi:MAG TPA: hypothetical protein PKU77_14350, partial [Ferruginibacter sp.]|nr:hypothetical protein [Ferruginibacter sp.]
MKHFFSFLMCNKYIFILFSFLSIESLQAQPTVLYTSLTATTPSPNNNRFNLMDIGSFRQARFQSNQSGTSGTFSWAFHSGTDLAPNYNPCWRANGSGQTLFVNGFVPAGYNNGAYYFATSGGNDGLLPAISSGNYYTFNVAENTSLSNNMQLLETAFQPVSISAVSGTATACSNLTVSITTSAAPASGEYLYVRYSLDSYASSQIITATGSGTAWLATIPWQSSAVSYYVYSSNKTKAAIDADVLSYGQQVHDLSTLNLAAGGVWNPGPSPSGFWIGGAAGDWHTAANWCGGVPNGVTNVVIPNGTTVSITTMDANANSISIEAGGNLTVTGINNINITSGGSFNNNGTYNAAPIGAVIFNGGATVTGNCIFNHVEISGSGGVDFGTSSNISTNGTLTLSDADATVTGNGPTYDCSATLIYNSGGIQKRTGEWSSASAGTGFPGNVLLTNNTSLNYPNGSIASRGICANLTVDAGANLYMDFGINDPTGPLLVGGNVLLNGSLTLSDATGGDLKIAGNWERGIAGSLNAKGRAVYFIGSGSQTIKRSGGGLENAFSVLIQDKPSGTLFLSDIPEATNVSLSSTGESLQLLNNGVLDLNGQTLILNGSGTRNIKTKGAQRQIQGKDGSIIDVLGNTIVSSESSGLLLTGNNVMWRISNAFINFGSLLTTINGTLQLDAGSFVDLNAPFYGTTSLLNYNNGGNYDRRVEWSGITAGTVGYPNNVLVTNNTNLYAGGIISPIDFRNVSFEAVKDIEIRSGSSIHMEVPGNGMVKSLKAGRDLTIAGSLICSNNIGSDVYVGRHWNRTGTFSHNNRAVFFDGADNATLTATGGETFAYIFLDKVNASNELLLMDTMRVINRLALQKGTLNLAQKDVLLLSSYTNTAQVSAIGTDASIDYSNSGRFVVQRYINNVGNWNLIASPTATLSAIDRAETIAESWQEGTPGDNYTSTGYGTRVTGPGANSLPFASGGNGLDHNSIGYSVKWWNGNTNAFNMTQFTNDPDEDSLVNRNTGYFLFARGDRSIGIGGTGSPTVLRSRGKIYIGNAGSGITPPLISYTSLPAGRFISVANPFASAINVAS